MAPVAESRAMRQAAAYEAYLHCLKSDCAKNRMTQLKSKHAGRLKSVNTINFLTLFIKCFVGSVVILKDNSTMNKT